MGRGKLIVPTEDPKAIAEAIMRLYNDRQRAKALGEMGRQHIIRHLNTENTVREMKRLYEGLAAGVTWD